MGIGIAIVRARLDHGDSAIKSRPVRLLAFKLGATAPFPVPPDVVPPIQTSAGQLQSAKLFTRARFYGKFVCDGCIRRIPTAAAPGCSTARYPDLRWPGDLHRQLVRHRPHQGRAGPPRSGSPAGARRGGGADAHLLLLQRALVEHRREHRHQRRHDRAGRDLSPSRSVIRCRRPASGAETTYRRAGGCGHPRRSWSRSGPLTASASSTSTGRGANAHASSAAEQPRRRRGSTLLRFMMVLTPGSSARPPCRVDRR